jgi:ornithine decarboxylase
VFTTDRPLVAPKLVTAKIEAFLKQNDRETPFLVVDLDVVAKNYIALQQELPDTQVFYAVKANPAPEILRLLVGLGSRFDAASTAEIEQCIAAGTSADRLSFGNTIKKSRDIAYAYDLGVRLMAFDSLVELEKIAQHAPGSQVYCRLFMECEGADWPLSKKFGCEPDMAADLLCRAAELGLVPYGVSFHIGSQQVNVHQWDLAISQVADLFADLAAKGIELQMINLGGGFPVNYQKTVPPIQVYTQAIRTALQKYFGNNPPHTMIEPGRSMVAEAGVLQSEVVLISTKSYTDLQRWVFLDVGKFGGLAETMDECIKYPIRTPYDHQAQGPVVIAGPTCDSADILYEKSNYTMPLALEVGDRVEILSAGAYTTTYASIGFNGFPPLPIYCI